jgi:hypothetical protein
MRPLKLRSNKYGARAWEYGGRTYHSKLEANFAARLNILKLAGEVWDFWPQVKVPLKVNGVRVCWYTVDFLVWFTDGREIWYEVKGMATPVGNLKVKLFRACYPDRVLEVVK